MSRGDRRPGGENPKRQQRKYHAKGKKKGQQSFFHYRDLPELFDYDKYTMGSAFVQAKVNKNPSYLQSGRR
ncbi:hypothetical protein LJC34_07190, partial [Oscillospiraceae bacterium OttesenSCG-928-G22]|nr:hypothetical protein [Oscillospiraceae bacterium OttesenSCG-928-G22]